MFLKFILGTLAVFAIFLVGVPSANAEEVIPPAEAETLAEALDILEIILDDISVQIASGDVELIESIEAPLSGVHIALADIQGTLTSRKIALANPENDNLSSATGAVAGVTQEEVITEEIGAVAEAEDEEILTTATTSFSRLDSLKIWVSIAVVLLLILGAWWQRRRSTPAILGNFSK